ncbi:MAG: STAS domain-containing protein [Selenomonadaceae bacterium]|nr:STAS domain-containing protein [Selenomonadaceae bacterium]
MRSENIDGVFTIFLKGEIDAQNANEIHEKISELLPARGEAPLAFDAKELTYISSAGLRLILSVQKQLGQKISVINVSPNVMEIFQMACFQTLMHIKGA